MTWSPTTYLILSLDILNAVTLNNVKAHQHDYSPKESSFATTTTKGSLLRRVHFYSSRIRQSVGMGFAVTLFSLIGMSRNQY